MKKPIAISEALSPFDVVVVPFPYADKLAEKKRPALVVSAPGVAETYGLVWLAMITSASNPRWDCDVGIANLSAAGLPAPSLVRPVKLATVDVGRILRRIGKLGAADAKAVKDRLRRMLDF
jgi:mRNA interferase MazF